MKTNPTPPNFAADILLVEDDPRDAELTLDLLQALHLPNRLIHLPDGFDLLDYLQGRGAYAGRDPARLPAVIFLDVNMPKLDGFATLAALQARPEFKGIPVFMLTGSKADRDRFSSRLLGAAGYIVKPLEVSEFSEALNRAGLSWMLAHLRTGAAQSAATQRATAGGP